MSLFAFVIIHQGHERKEIKLCLTTFIDLPPEKDHFPRVVNRRGHIVADTLLPMMFLGLRKLGNISCGHKMFLNKIRNIFCVPDTKFVSATNVAREGNRGNICVGNNVSSFARPFTHRRFRGAVDFAIKQVGKYF